MFNFFRQNKAANVATDTRDGKLIELKGIKKAYQTEAGPFLALKGIDLTINRGEFVGVVGKSGSGKSTLINMITGIDRPTDGEIWINDTAIHNFSEGQMAKWRGVNMGVVFQFFQLLPTLTVVENVMLPMDFCNVYAPGERRDKAIELLKLMDIEQQADKLPTMISGGQQQRAAIARALANDPPIVVADEPTGNLDSKTAAQVFDLFKSLVDAGKTFLMVTHDDELASQLYRVITIADGELEREHRRGYDDVPPMTVDYHHNANEDSNNSNGHKPEEEYA
ncbi:MAG: ABC transporter ATP-binding protein [Chloroflexota bacterium]